MNSTIGARSLEATKKDERGVVYDCGGMMYV